MRRSFKMDISEIVTFWRGQQVRDDRQYWAHRLDQSVLKPSVRSFNLDFPVSPYVGDVLNARVIILCARAAYDSKSTPTEFPDNAAVEAYRARVDDPAGPKWSLLARYYDEKTNYADLIRSGEAVLVNACAYRSPKSVSRKTVDRLESVKFARKWLIEAVLPKAARNERLVIAKHPGLWNLAWEVSPPGVVNDSSPRLPKLSRTVRSRIDAFLANRA